MTAARSLAACSSKRSTNHPTALQARSRAWSRRWAMSPPCHHECPGSTARRIVRPRDVQVDGLTRRQSQRVLARRDPVGRPHRSRARRSSSRPLCAGRSRRLAFSSQSAIRFTPPRPERRISSRYCPRRLGRHEPSVPHVLRRPLEAELVELAGEPEQHAQRRRQPDPIVPDADVALLDDPVRLHEVALRREHDVTALHRQLDDRRWHRPEAVERPGGGPAHEGLAVRPPTGRAARAPRASAAHRASSPRHAPAR